MIGIVTVLYNSETVLNEFFSTLNIQSYKDFILYIVDNNSPDNSLQLAKSLSEKVSFRTVFIPNKQNYGVAKGNNQGIEAALSDGCEYILLSNNDVVLNERTIGDLLERMVKKECFAAVPKIYTPEENHIWCAGGVFKKITCQSIHRGFNQVDNGQFDFEDKISYTPTCFMLFHKSVFEKVGMMDEKYFVYWDDTDFIYRMRKNKIDILYTYIPTLIHKESVCTGDKSDFFYSYIFRNRIYFERKHLKSFIFYYLFVDYFYLFTIRLFKMRKNLRQWNIILTSMNEGLKY